MYNNKNRGWGQGRPAFRSRSNFRARGRGESQFSRRDATSKRCWNCGGNFPHKFGPCPAKGKVCHGCHKRDHFKKMCPEHKVQRPRKVNSVDEKGHDESDDSDDSYNYGISYSDTVNKKVNSVRVPFTDVKVNDTPITQIAWMRWPNVGPARVPTLGQRWQSALAQCNVARRGNVGPTVVNQRQPSANQPTINQRWANASMLSGHIAHAWPIKSIISEDHGNHVFF